MKSRATRAIGRKVRLDGRVCQIIGTASQENKPMYKLQFEEDGSITWAFASDITPADEPVPPPKAKARRR